jgi:ketosteroid isomerase-like protein
MTDDAGENGRHVDVTRLFTEALNARDLEALLALVTDDVEFRNPQGGRSLRGPKGVEDLVRAAADTNLLLVRIGSEEIEVDSGIDHVTVQVRELIGKSELTGRAVFDVRGERIAAFDVITAT